MLNLRTESTLESQTQSFNPHNFRPQPEFSAPVNTRSLIPAPERGIAAAEQRELGIGIGGTKRYNNVRRSLTRPRRN